jgi:3-hydroxyisobutyrate dehydrogenase-like beta-hydroxyacid dehydrogenase
MSTTNRIGIIHPGEMGVSVAASAVNSGCEVYWASEGRSPETRERAAKHGLKDAGTVSNLCKTCSIILSICPPHAAEDVAWEVLGCGFSGMYVDANAISPQRTLKIGETMAAANVEFVDGGIIGGPAWTPGETVLYLAGKGADEIAECFVAGPLETRGLGEEIGKASALKMCYAAYSKGTTALLCAVLATAEELGVREALNLQWTDDDPGFAEKTEMRVRRVTKKAWRFAGEMEEISATFDEAGLPGEFHAGAAETYRRLARFKGWSEAPELDEVLAAMIKLRSRSRS